MYGLLTVTQEQLETLESFSCDLDATFPTDLPDKKYTNWVVERRQKLASAFREFMTENQSFGSVNSNRKEFYARVIKAAITVNFSYFINCDCNIFFFQVQRPVQSCY